MRRLAVLPVLAALLAAEETQDLDHPQPSLKAKDLRAKADPLWAKVQPLWELVRTKKEVAPADAAAAMPALEEAIELYERSLREEWSRDVNKTLGDAVRAWFKLRAVVPAPPAEAAAMKEATARKRAIREFVMDYASERRTTSLFRPCPSCDGRGENASPFGERRQCTACQTKGRLLDRDGVLAAYWLRWSPLYRAQARHEQEVNRKLRGGAPDAKKDDFAPYVRGVQIKEVEYFGDWARVKAQDQMQPTLTSQKTEKVDTVYVLFRVGNVWYLYDDNADDELLEIPEPQGTAEKPG